VIALGVLGLAAIICYPFVLRSFFITSGAMLPTLRVNDVLLVNEFEYDLVKPRYGDIVVFPPPIAAGNVYIKRLIGAPGDAVRMHDGIVYRNGVALDEPYTAEKARYELDIKDYGIFVDGTRLDPTTANIPPKALWSAPNRIPDGCYFMLGDNRNDSEDSHIWGFAQADGVFASGARKGQRAGFTGHAFLLLLPSDRIRILR
jgi:signal peptidase I